MDKAKVMRIGMVVFSAVVGALLTAGVIPEDMAKAAIALSVLIGGWALPAPGHAGTKP